MRNNRAHTLNGLSGLRKERWDFSNLTGSKMWAGPKARQDFSTTWKFWPQLRRVYCMILTPEEYERASSVVQGLLTKGEGVSYNVCDELGMERETLFSIYQQAFVKRQKRLTPMVESQLGQIMQRVRHGECIYSISIELGFSPFKLAKMVSASLYGESRSVSELVCDETLIMDDRLRNDLMQCCEEDANSSYKSNLLKHCVGREYEEVLYDMMRRKHMCFLTEEELRKKGKPKTPDALFLIPMGLLESGTEGRVVNWIDSKAMFGSPDVYAEHLDQIKGYVNRYGPGLIIYWHGYVSTLKNRDDMVTISERFPDNWIFPTGELADGTCPDFLRNSTSSATSSSIK